jgi:hypothetical protein
LILSYFLAGFSRETSLDWLESVTEENIHTEQNPLPRVLEDTDSSTEANSLKLIPDNRKKSSGEPRKKSSVNKGEPETGGGKRRKSSLFRRLKNFKSLPNINLPRIFKLSKLLKKERSQPNMQLPAALTAAAAVSSPLAAAAAPADDTILRLGRGGFEELLLAAIGSGGWKRRRKGRIRTVLIWRQVNTFKKINVFLVKKKVDRLMQLYESCRHELFS